MTVPFGDVITIRKNKIRRQIVAIMITIAVVFGGLSSHIADAQSIDDTYIFIQRRLAYALDQVSLDNIADDEHDYSTDPRVLAIRTYFENLDMPAAQYAEDFIRAADVNNLTEWSLLPAIAKWETTGCRYTIEHISNSRENNCFGYGPSGYSFESIPEGIEYVTATLAGNNERLAHYYNSGKTLEEKLHHYNSVKKGYAKRILSSMAEIESLVVTSENA
ncbi:hypothetical protein A2997_00840 [Candidatus Nomurabacteria bacterium RIFCSPLOWO2_01_FULL_36_10b]|uniref:Mannosyl-glycoprotein endo-beta-N-acetylglucosamidase-like domain-containing protein n=1 Tax=Candidatus Nomurabacteria bacterium RIFCSPLOWO2_01_FULL_36_10b TaxID=1801766 RepID=A0A1F6WQ19_9BACT|nr:MAG: hypothetical protein A2997_00840 [Candidatus Nomurabacteria bacterium RIFCSPLOWO2_01_FULL_36_10b]